MGTGVSEEYLREYEYESNGNLTRVRESGWSLPNWDAPSPANVRFKYDDLNRLASAKYNPIDGKNYNESYKYSSTGNIEKMKKGKESLKFEYNNPIHPQALSAIQSKGKDVARYEYSVSGNMLAEEVEGSLQKELRWDWEGRLVSARTENLEYMFQYGAFGNRTTAVSFELDTGEVREWAQYLGEYTETRFIPAGAEEPELDSYMSYFYLGRRVAQFSMEGPIVEDPDSFWMFHHADHLGSTVLTTNEDGLAVRNFWYSPFGTTRSGEVDSPYDVNYLFTGKEEHSDELGLAYFGARYYYPAIGRWVSADPLLTFAPEVAVGDPQSNNLYAYARNSPSDLVDPTGLFQMPYGDIFKAAITWGYGRENTRLATQSAQKPSGKGDGGGGGSSSGGYSNEPQEFPGDTIVAFIRVKMYEIGPDGKLVKLEKPVPIPAKPLDFLDYMPVPGAGVVVGPGAKVSVGIAGSLWGYIKGKWKGWFKKGVKNSKGNADDAVRASTPVGKRGSQLTVQPGTNIPATIKGRKFTGHALDQMQSRGIKPSAVLNAIENGVKAVGSKPGTFTHVYENVKAVTNAAGDVVTAILQ